MSKPSRPLNECGVEPALANFNFKLAFEYSYNDRHCRLIKVIVSFNTIVDIEIYKIQYNLEQIFVFFYILTSNFYYKTHNCSFDCITTHNVSIICQF